MTLLSRFAGTATKAVTDYNDTQMSVPLTGLFDNMRTTSGEWVGTDSALKIVTVYACVRLLSETVASLPLLLYRRLPGGGKERATDHELYDTLHDQPNPEMTSFMWRETMMGHLATWGNSYNEKVYDPNGRLQLWPLRPDRMEVSFQDNQRVYDYISPMGQRQRMEPGSVFHVRGLSSNGLKGYSPISLQREALGLYQAAQSFGTNTFRNNARPAVVLTHPKNVTVGAIERLAAQFESLKGSGNAGKTILLEEGLTVTEVGIPPKDAQYIETRKYQGEEIARMFNVPPHMVGIMDHATFSNIEHQSIEFVQFKMRPWFVRIEQEINSQLLGPGDVFAELLVDGLLRGDAQARATALQIQRQNGVINADEWREIENRNPIEDGSGQEYWRPLNMKSGGEEPTPEPPPTESVVEMVPVAVSGNGSAP